MDGIGVLGGLAACRGGEPAGAGDGQGGTCAGDHEPGPEEIAPSGCRGHGAAMAVNHVLFDDHRGPFKAVVESAGKGVRVRFDGWGKEPFVASADRELRVIYWVAGKKEIDFTADATSAGEVRVRPADRPVIAREAHCHGAWRARRGKRYKGLGRWEGELNPSGDHRSLVGRHRLDWFQERNPSWLV